MEDRVIDDVSFFECRQNAGPNCCMDLLVFFLRGGFQLCKAFSKEDRSAIQGPTLMIWHILLAVMVEEKSSLSES